jgi:diguanylate cyclase (GGDEF)-like protein
VLLCRELGWPDEVVRSLGEAAYLHDIGKIAISDRILTKAGKLNDREWALMRQHPVLSAEIVRPLYGDDIVLGVRHHHERYDGRGYPDGLAGEDIPAIARAMCVADSYDAMSFERPYHRGLSYSQCRDELERCKGSQFDPSMADAFLRVLDRIAGLRSRALVIAEQAAAQIDGDLHSELAAQGAEGDDAYRRIVAGLRAVRSANPDVRFITTMAERDGRYVFVCDTETDESYRSHLGDEVVNDEEIAHVLAGERPDLCVIAADEFGVWNSAMAPIRRRSGDIVGVVTVDIAAYETAEESGLYGDSTDTVTGLLRGAAERVTRAELDATVDALTGLANHRHFHERLAAELTQAQSADAELSLVLCDVDRFAACNALLGYTKGDEVLRGLAQVIERTLGRGGLCARLGGDEFAVVLSGAGSGAALEAIESLRAAVAAAGLGHPSAPLTLGVGVATFPSDATDKEALLGTARWAASLAKIRGGDCVVTCAERPQAQFEGRRSEAVRYLALMAELAHAKMLYAEKHAEAVARLAIALAVDLGLGQGEAADAGDAARLCDIGQFATPGEVLGKAGSLSQEEWRLVCEHPRAGERLLRGMDLDAVADAVAHHHERFDGTGYPSRLKGEDIPLGARIVAVAATFQALVNRRPYRLEQSQESALEEMRRCAGSQFDPSVVEALERVLSHGGSAS